MGRRRAGFSLLEMVIVVAILLALGAVVIPHVQEAMRQARESAALQHIRAIHSAQALLLGRSGRLASTLAELGPAGARLIPEDLASGSKGGYRFLVAATAEGYAVTAVPENKGDRSFYSDETLVTRESRGLDPAGAASPPLR